MSNRLARRPSGLDGPDLLQWLEAQTIRTPAGCLEWQGSRNDGGYGITGRYRRTNLVHRLVWMLTNGDIARGLVLCHSCDNPPCINIRHLFLGSHRDNVSDKIAKGRQAHGHLYGEESPQSSFEDATVIDIFRWHEQGMSQTAIAKQLGCSQSLVSLILLRKKRAWASQDLTYTPRIGRPPRPSSACATPSWEG